MTEHTDEMTSLMDEITAVIQAAEKNDLDTLYEHRASIISMYAQAMVEFHFHEEQIEWLNDIVQTVEDNKTNECLEILGQADDTDDIFLGAQFAAMMAGCFHHDELMTAVQAFGMRALLEAIASQKDPENTN